MVSFSLIFLVVAGFVVLGLILAIGLAISHSLRPKQSYPVQDERRHLANRARKRAQRRGSAAPLWITAGVFLFIAFLLFAFVGLTYVSVKEVRNHDAPATESTVSSHPRQTRSSSRGTTERSFPRTVERSENADSGRRPPSGRAESKVHEAENHSSATERVDSIKGDNEVQRAQERSTDVALTTPVTITMKKDAAVFHLADPYENWKRLDLFISNGEGKVTQSPSSARWVTNDDPPPPLVYKSSIASIRSPSPMSGNKIVGYSTSWDPNPSESFLEAESSAVHQLAAQYLWELAKLAEKGKKLDSKIFLDIDPIQQCLHIARQSLKRYEVQRFEQKVEKSIATYYRTAVLYQLPHRHLKEVQSDLLQVARDVKLQQFKEKRNVVWTALAGGVLALVVFLLYLSLNSTTKGYFTWRLRLFSLLLLAGLYFGLFQFREWFF